MEHKLGRAPAMALTAAASVAAYFLRLNQLNTSLDESGRFLAGAGNSFFTWFTVLMVIAFAGYAWLLRKRGKYGAVASRSLTAVVRPVAAALAVILGSMAMFLSPEEKTDMALAAAGVVTGLCWVGVAAARYKGKRANAALFMLPVLFFAAKLLCDFQSWSRDPAILDYCYSLLALISAMCAQYHLGGFCFDKGKRRLTVFFCFCGVYFGAAALAQARMREVAVYGGAVLWLADNAWLLLRPGKKPVQEG